MELTVKLTDGHRKYQNNEYDDETVENLMRYFGCDGYNDLLAYLKNYRLLDN
jgi:hypothetical protein